MNRKILGGVAALAVVATGTGLYLAGPAQAGDAQNDSAVAASQSPGHPLWRANHRARRLRRAGVHGQATVRTRHGFVGVVWQRGRLTANSGGILTVRSLDGTTMQWRTNGTTKVRKDARRSTVGALSTGDFVLVAGRSDGGPRTAVRVVVPQKIPQRATQTPTPSPS